MDELEKGAIIADGAYYAADHQYRCSNCGRNKFARVSTGSEDGVTVVVNKCKCGNKITYRYKKRERNTE